MVGTDEIWLGTDVHPDVAICRCSVLFYTGSAVRPWPKRKPLSRAWILDPRERAECWIVVKRMIVWFVCAGVSGLVVSALVNYARKAA